MKALLLKMLLTFSACLTIAGIYLDAKVQSLMGGQLWELPAAIYSAPLVLAADAPIARQRMLFHLDQLGYRSVRQVTMPGQYQCERLRCELLSRAFSKNELSITERYLLIDFDEYGRIEEITDQLTGESLTSVRLEPLLLTTLGGDNPENRLYLSRQETPDLLLEAIMLVEDDEFYQHQGVRPLSILRALLANITAGKTVQGGSTLTQQLAKNLFLSNHRTLTRKFLELGYALILELRYSKPEILQAYVNEVYLGQDGKVAIHGFELASRYYFNRRLAELEPSQIATLVGMLKGASYYNPVRFPTRTQQRRDFVLRKLLEAKYISRSEYLTALDQPVKPHQLNRDLVSNTHPHFLTQVRRELTNRLSYDELTTKGLSIITTLDPFIQNQLVTTVTSGFTELTKDMEELNVGALVVDYTNGAVVGMVGDKKTSYAGFNRVLDAKRPIGSLIKPLLALGALEQPQQFTLATQLADRQRRITTADGDEWQPRNWDNNYLGSVDLLETIVNSRNLPMIDLVERFGLTNSLTTLERLGYTDSYTPHISLALGSIDMSPWQVAQLYQTLANQGRLSQLRALRSVYNAADRLLWQPTLVAQERMNQSASYLATFMLQQVARRGTARDIQVELEGSAIAAKTGTTNDARDAWFAAFDGRYLVVIWVGRDDNQPMGLSGATGALPLASDFFDRVGITPLSIDVPDAVAFYFLTEDGQLSTTPCPGRIRLPAIRTALPKPQPIACDRRAPSLQPETEPSKPVPWWRRWFG